MDMNNLSNDNLPYNNSPHNNLPKFNQQNFTLFFVGFITATLLLTVLSSFNLIELSPKRYAYLNMETIITAVNDELTKQNLNNEEISKKLNSTKANFDSLLKDYRNKNHAIVFSSLKVIAGAKDITDYFKEKLLAKLKQDQDKSNIDSLNLEQTK